MPGAAFSDLGPVLPPAGLVEMRAREIIALARRAEEFAGPGPRHDLALALRQFERMRAILDGGQEA